MFNALYNAILEWSRTTNERQKLQHAYITIAVTVVLIAGLVSLLDSQTGQDLLVVSVAAGGIFLANAVLWSILDSVVIAKLSNRRKK
jgi:cell division protein FtsW (lipid II flippase)